MEIDEKSYYNGCNAKITFDSEGVDNSVGSDFPKVCFKYFSGLNQPIYCSQSSPPAPNQYQSHSTS